MCLEMPEFSASMMVDRSVRPAGGEYEGASSLAARTETLPEDQDDGGPDRVAPRPMFCSSIPFSSGSVHGNTISSTGDSSAEDCRRR